MYTTHTACVRLHKLASAARCSRRLRVEAHLTDLIKQAEEEAAKPDVVITRKPSAGAGVASLLFGSDAQREAAMDMLAESATAEELDRLRRSINIGRWTGVGGTAALGAVGGGLGATGLASVLGSKRPKLWGLAGALGGAVAGGLPTYLVTDHPVTQLSKGLQERADAVRPAE